MRLMIAVLLMASAAHAETPITAAEFEAFASGKTLVWSEGGEAYGQEAYLPGRALQWSEDGSSCLGGSYAQGDAGEICFTYDDGTDPDCWLLYRKGDALHGTLQSEAEPRKDYVITVGHAPLACAATP